jgi:mono/diheme cytochrome c family protein
MRFRAGAWAAAALAAAAAQAQEAPAGSVERGHGIYIQQMCHNCHGTVGQGGGVAGPKIAPQPLAWVAFARQVRTPRQAMPPYTAKNLPDQDLADVYAYVLSIKPGPQAKDIPLLSGN